MKMEIIPIEKIKPNPYQPRENFPKESIKELAESIKSVGMLQPIIVREHGKGYQIIAGERRWRACQFAKEKNIPAIIKDVAEKRILLESLIENWHRENLTDIEKENATSELWESGEFKTQESLAHALGTDPPTLSHLLETRKFRKKIAHVQGNVSTRTLIHTSPLEENDRIKVIEKVAKKELSTDKVDDYVKILKTASESVKKAMLKSGSRITPRIAEEISELPEEKQSEAIDDVERHRLDERETRELVKQIKEEVPTLPLETWEEIRESYEELQKETKERLKSPEVKARGKLFKNWLAHTTLYGGADSAHCPVCGADCKSLVWKCHDLNIKDALEKARKDYQESIKEGG